MAVRDRPSPPNVDLHHSQDLGSRSARTRLVRTAASLFQRQGYHGTGLNDLVRESGSPKGSLYHYFPGGKEQIAEEAVRRAGDDVARIIEAAFESATSFPEGARNLATRIADWFEASGYGEGCPITSVLLETVPSSERLSAACQDVIQGWIAGVERHARRCGKDSSSRFLGEAVILTIEGAWIIARAKRSKSPFETAATLIERACDHDI